MLDKVDKMTGWVVAKGQEACCGKKLYPAKTFIFFYFWLEIISHLENLIGRKAEMALLREALRSPEATLLTPFGTKINAYFISHDSPKTGREF